MEKVKDTLAEQQQKGSFSLTIITGNSSVLQKRIFDEILKDSTYTYYIPSWNLGQIVVGIYGVIIPWLLKSITDTYQRLI